MMFSFFGSYNYVFQSVYHFNQKSIGLTFLGILVGFIFAIATFGIFDATLYAKASAKADGKPAPEHRLYSAMLGSVLLPVGLFWFAWAPGRDVHWIVPVLAGVPFGWGCLTIFVSFSSLTRLAFSSKLTRTDLSNNLPSRRLPSRQRSLSSCRKWYPALWLWCRFSTLHDTNVSGYGNSLGRKCLRIYQRRDDACALDLLLERQELESEESLRYKQILRKGSG